MLSNKDFIAIKDLCNEFSDRWPDVYLRVWHKYQDPIHFQKQILWLYVRWADLHPVDRHVVYQYIDRLCEIAKVGKIRYKVTVEEISTGEL